MKNPTNTNKNLTVQFKVQDYSAWRTAYDGREQGRTSAGITNGKVYRRVEDPNDVVILSDVADVTKASAFLGTDELKAAMQKSGVQGSPTIRFAA
jgi:hypothetical protein